MARIPWIFQIGGVALSARHTMALAAKIVELAGREFPGIPRADFGGIFGMVRRRSMTSLASDSQLVRLNYLLRRDTQRTGRVATEAAEDSRFRIEDAMPDSADGCMARRAADAIEPAIPGLIELDIGFGI